MSELLELAKKYGTDKVGEGYIELYEYYFTKVNNWKDEEINLMEIGVFDGNSMLMWQDYFTKANIIGIDININERCKLNEEKFSDRVKIHIGDQTDEKFLNEICKDKQFEVIIDDGGHKMSQQTDSFKILWKYLKPGGLYIIEDLHTSYHDHFLDLGPYTTMNFLLERLHDLNLGGKRKYTNDDLNEYEKTLDFIHFHKSIVFIRKK